MKRSDAYDLKGKNYQPCLKEFINNIQDKGFTYSMFTRSIYYDSLKNIGEIRADYLIIPKDKGNDSQATKDARSKLRNLADKFKP